MMLMPLAFRSRTISCSLSTSRPLSAAVGSSMMMSLAFMVSALEISTICCSATLSERTSVRGPSSSPSSSMILRASLNIRPQSIRPFRSGSRPRYMFSATDMAGSRLNSW